MERLSFVPMHLSIEPTRLIVESDDASVVLEIVPRFAVDDDETELVVRVDGTEVAHFRPEQAGDATPREWVWDGGVPCAQRLAHLALQAFVGSLLKGGVPSPTRRLHERLLDKLEMRPSAH